MSSARRVTIDAATREDARLLHALTQSAWQGTVAPDSSAYRETPETVEAVFDAGGGAFLLRVDGQPAGAARWVPVPHALRSWEIKRAGVLPAWRGQGMAEPLVQALLSAARQHGVQRLQLGVRADQPRLIAFWRSFGFALDAQVALSSRNPLTAPAVTMSRLIEPIDARPGDGASPKA